MSQVVLLSYLNKLVAMPSGEQRLLVWADKLFSDKDIYEISTKSLESDGFTTWFVEIKDGMFHFISCSMQASPETLVIRLAVERRKELNGTNGTGEKD